MSNSPADIPLQQNKRKPADDSRMNTARASKQRRLDEIRSTNHSEPEVDSEAESGFDPDSDSEANSEYHSETDSDHSEPDSEINGNTIEFDELYQDGKAKYKHCIVTHKVNGGRYIILCRKHGQHFGLQPLRGASKHLSSNTPGKGGGTHSRVFQLMGVKVLNCDAEKQRRYNLAFEVALANGYKVKGNPHARRPPEQTATEDTQAQDQGNMAEGVVDPVPGEIYLANLGGQQTLDAVLVLPRNCFGDPSVEDVGLVGSLANDTFLLGRVPECYRICPDTGNITGWEEGYEDGGDMVREREYPAMKLAGKKDLREAPVAWLPVKDIHAYDRDTWAGDGELIGNYAHLQQFEMQREEARAVATRQGGPTTGPESTTLAAVPELRESDASHPVPQALEGKSVV